MRYGEILLTVYQVLCTNLLKSNELLMPSSIHPYQDVSIPIRYVYNEWNEYKMPRNKTKKKMLFVEDDETKMKKKDYLYSN